MWFLSCTMNRRSFLRTSAATAVFTGTANTLSALAADNAYRANIGLQLYSLRNELNADIPGTIKALVDAGYKQGEMYGFPNCDDTIKAANDHGLGLHSTHFEWETAVNPSDEGFSDFKKIVEKANKIKLTHLVVPYLHDKDRKSLDDYKRVAGNLNKAAVIAKKAGIQLAYHNHSFEFEPMGGSTGFDVFTKEFAPEMKFELDVFWVKAGGVDPVTLIKKLSGRVSQLHLKDLKKGLELPIYGGMPKEAFKELGNGMIPMEPIIEAGKAAGVVHCHVEQDHSPNPLKSVKESVEYLKTL
jgi:sugar phosphate isomerase/epimerase